MSKVKSTDYICIQGWMVSDLKLTGNQLMLYALIHGFSRDGINEFSGSINYICEWLGCSRPTAISARDKLVEDGLIYRRSWTDGKGEPRISYRVNDEKIPDGSKEILPPGSKESLPPSSKKSLPRGSKKSLPNNINIYNSPYSPPKGDARVRKKSELSDAQNAAFDIFWSVYPKRTAKETAKRAWFKLDPDKDTVDLMVQAIAIQKQSDQWQRGVIPHPSTWINQRRWEDEITTKDRQTTEYGDEVPIW